MPTSPTYVGSLGAALRRPPSHPLPLQLRLMPTLSTHPSQCKPCGIRSSGEGRDFSPDSFLSPRLPRSPRSGGDALPLLYSGYPCPSHSPNRDEFRQEERSRSGSGPSRSADLTPPLCASAGTTAAAETEFSDDLPKVSKEKRRGGGGRTSLGSCSAHIRRDEIGKASERPNAGCEEEEEEEVDEERAYYKSRGSKGGLQLLSTKEAATNPNT